MRGTFSRRARLRAAAELLAVLVEQSTQRRVPPGAVRPRLPSEVRGVAAPCSAATRQELDARPQRPRPLVLRRSQTLAVIVAVHICKRGDSRRGDTSADGKAQPARDEQALDLRGA